MTTATEPSTDVISFARRLDQLADRHPDRPAVIFSAADGNETVLTWAELAARSLSLAHHLAGLGVNDSSFLAIGLPNCLENVIATCASWRLGACTLPVKHDLPARERDEILALGAPAAVISDWPDVAGIRRQDIADLPADTRPLPDVVAAPGRAICSGGSTGRSKIIVNPTPLAIAEAQFSTLTAMGLAAGDVQLVGGALYHNSPNGCLTYGLALDHTIVLMDRFDAARAVDLIERHRVQFLFLAPTMMQRIIRLPGIDDRDLSSLRMLFHTAAPCPEWLKRRWLDLVGPEKVIEAFGATEGVGATTIRGDEWLARPGSVGRPMGCDVRILDEDGHPLPAGEVGEIFMRNHSSAPTYSYLGADSARTTADGFTSVGDLGWVDGDGYLYPADRRLDLIITGGANVYPAQVEAALTEHAAVADAAVIGLPDDEWGRRVHAIVQPADPARPPSTEALMAHLRERLASYKLPKTYELVVRLPRDEAGKIRRSALLAERAT